MPLDCRQAALPLNLATAPIQLNSAVLLTLLETAITPYMEVVISLIASISISHNAYLFNFSLVFHFKNFN